jgi:hypothetical protein
MPASATTTSEKAPHSTPVSLPPPRTKSAPSRTGWNTMSVGIDTNVRRYRMPAAREVRRIASGSGRVCGELCTVVDMSLPLSGIRRGGSIS